MNRVVEDFIEDRALCGVLIELMITPFYEDGLARYRAVLVWPGGETLEALSATTPTDAIIKMADKLEESW